MADGVQFYVLLIKQIKSNEGEHSRKHSKCTNMLNETFMLNETNNQTSGVEKRRSGKHARAIIKCVK